MLKIREDLTVIAMSCGPLCGTQCKLEVSALLPHFFQTKSRLTRAACGIRGSKDTGNKFNYNYMHYQRIVNVSIRLAFPRLQ